MKYILKNFIILIIGVYSTGCAVGHQAFIDIKNDQIGLKAITFKPYKFDTAGVIEHNFRKVGQGFTHITYDKNKNIVQHWDLYEILSHYIHKEEIGKCKYYYIIDSKTKIIKSWGFEPDSNPLSCRTWM